MSEDEEYSGLTSYPSYLCSWLSGENEDERENIALIALMDSGMLVYRFSVSVDLVDDVREQLYQVFSGLTINKMVDD